MANLAPQFGRLVRHIAKNLTSSVAVGTIIALTGFGPEHWFAAAFRYVEMPQVGLVWPSWLDIRALIVSIGVAIVVADVLVRRMHREKSMTAPAGAEAPLPRSDQVIRTPRSRPGEEGPAADVAARATEAATPSVAPSLPDQPSIVVLPFANMNTPARAWNILDRHRHLPCVTESLRKQTGGDVGSAAGRKAEDDTNRH